MSHKKVPWDWEIKVANNIRLAVTLEGKPTNEVVDAVIEMANKHIANLWAKYEHADVLDEKARLHHKLRDAEAEILTLRKLLYDSIAAYTKMAPKPSWED